MRVRAGLALLLVLSHGSAVGAAPFAPLAQVKTPAPGSKKAVKAAKKHFEAAKKAYKAGAYREAVAELDQAVEYDPDGKDLFYNLGLVHEKLGEIDAAVAAFKRYTELETDEAELERAIQTLRRLEGARDELERKRRAEENREKAPAEVRETTRVEVVEVPAEASRKGRLDEWVYATAGLAVVAVGVGSYLGFKALSTRKSADEATGPNLRVDELKDRADEAHRYAVMADISFVVAALSAGAATALYFARDEKPKDESPRVGAAVTPNGAFVGVGGAF